MPPLPPPRHSTSHAIYSLQNTYAPHMTQRLFNFLAYHIAGVTKERTTSILPFNEKILVLSRNAHVLYHPRLPRSIASTYVHRYFLVRTHPSGMHHNINNSK